ncbi:hypothetical protein F4703DRAFT_1928573 [Phycomyces blakesleeanus]
MLCTFHSTLIVHTNKTNISNNLSTNNNSTNNTNNLLIALSSEPTPKKASPSAITAGLLVTEQSIVTHTLPLHPTHDNNLAITPPGVNPTDCTTLPSLQAQFFYQNLSHPPTINALIPLLSSLSLRQSPTTIIQVGPLTLDALINTGTNLSIIKSNIVAQLGLPIDHSQKQRFHTIMNESHCTLGVTYLSIFGVLLPFHVLNNVHHNILLRWNNLSTLGGIIHDSPPSIVYHPPGHPAIALPLSLSLLVPAIDQATITFNTVYPTPTHLFDSTIDADDSLPMLVSPCHFRRDINDTLDKHDSLSQHNIQQPTLSHVPLVHMALKYFNHLPHKLSNYHYNASVHPALNNTPLILNSRSDAQAISAQLPPKENLRQKTD